MSCHDALQLADAVPSVVMQMRAAVKAVAQRFPTAIVSGRGRDKVENFVQLPELFYAGSHGMDIAGPRVGVTGASVWGFLVIITSRSGPLLDYVAPCLRVESATAASNKPSASAQLRVTFWLTDKP